MRHRTEVDDDVRVARGQPLAGAQVERHACPAPVLHLGAQRDEGLAAAVGRHLDLVEVADDRLPLDVAGLVLAAHDVAPDRLGGERLQALEHLQLLVADRVGVGARRWLHRDHRQQLQRVVLDHVAQRAGAVVEVAARADADRLGDRDLDVGDAVAPPQRLEQRVAETQRGEVLHRRLAEVVVDAQRLALGERRAHDAVDLAGARQVVTQRLLEHDAHVGAVEADAAELLADLREQVRARREVEHDGVGAALVDPLLEPDVIVGPRQVHAPVLHLRGEAGELVVGRPFRAVHVGEPLAQEVPVLVVAAFVARDAEQPATRRQLAVARGLEQRRDQLAPREVAGAAEEDEVEGHGRVHGGAKAAPP